MFSSVKNFLITLLISLAFFAAAAYMVVGLVLGNLGATVGGGAVTEAPSAGGEVTGDSDNIFVGYGDGGESFNFLLIGTDYRPSQFANYDPEVIKMLFGTGGATSSATSPSDLAPTAPSDVASDAGVDGERTEASGGNPIIPGGFYEEKYRSIDTDILLLVRVDKESGNYRYTLLPTDACVAVNKKYVKLGEIYGKYGLQTLLDAVRNSTGVHVDYHALVSAEAFPGVVDKLFPDGISYYVPCDMKYDDYSADMHIDLKEGRQTLNGKAILGMLSFDSYTNGQGSRANTVLTFVKTMVSQLTNITNYKTIINTVNAFGEIDSLLVTTNFKASDFLKNIDMIFKYSSVQSDVNAVTKYVTIGGQPTKVIDDVATIKAFSTRK